jgi:hypothetical protein
VRIEGSMPVGHSRSVQGPIPTALKVTSAAISETQTPIVTAATVNTAVLRRDDFSDTCIISVHAIAT